MLKSLGIPQTQVLAYSLVVFLFLFFAFMQGHLQSLL